MSKKLNEQIKEFIVEQKKSNVRLSCRGLSSLIKEKFQVEISKSLINNVIKESNLSSPVGRRKVKERVVSAKEQVTLPETPAKAPEIQPPRQGSDFMENGGFFFLKVADLKLGLTLKLAEAFSAHFPDLPKQGHQRVIETLIYAPYFKDKKSLWVLVGKEIPEESLIRHSEEYGQIPLFELKEPLAKAGISHNINNINELWQGSLLWLNSYIVHFFPPEYQFLDFLAMQERFYSLSAKVEIRAGLLILQFFYPRGFLWANDVIWQEGFSHAANRVNEAKILSPDRELIWINPQVKFP